MVYVTILTMIQILTIPVTSYQQNCRIVVDDETNEAVCIDPGGDILSVLAVLPPSVALSAIWITHSHIDHVSGVAELLSSTESPLSVMAHADDVVNRRFLSQQSAMMRFPYSGEFEVTHHVSHYDSLTVGNHSFQVLHTPGHAIGHVSYFMEDATNIYQRPILIAGDALFKGSIGRTDLPGGNHDLLIKSIKDHLFVLPDETIVCSGHGPNTTIGHEKKTNPFFL